MKLLMIRHAIAIDREDAGDMPDESRELTAEGVRKMKQNVSGLRRLKMKINEIWTSPLVRARQTAELVHSGLQLVDGLREVDELKPDGDFESLLDKLRGAASLSGVALVGHEPYLSGF